MAYCTSSDVQAEFKALEWNSTAITSAKVTEFIVQADAFINAKLGKRYVTPITGTESLSIVKMISIYLVADRVKKILYTLTGNQTTDQISERRKSMTEMALAMIDDILAGDMDLPDATLRDSSGGVSSYTYENDFEHTLSRDEVQW